MEERKRGYISGALAIGSADSVGIELDNVSTWDAAVGGFTGDDRKVDRGSDEGE